MNTKQGQEVQTRQTGRGKWTLEQLRSWGYLDSGKPVVLVRSGGLEEKYIPVGGRLGTKVVSLETGQTLPIETVFNPDRGEYSVRELSSAEKAIVRNMSSDPGKETYKIPGVAEYLPASQMRRALRKRPGISAVSYEGLVIANPLSPVDDFGKNVPGSMFIDLQKRMRSQSVGKTGARIVQEVQELKRIGIIGRDSLQEIHDVLQEKSSKAKFSWKERDFQRTRDLLKGNQRMILDIVWQTRDKSSKAGVLDHISELLGKKVGYVSSTSDKGFQLTELHVVNSIDEIQGKAAELIRAENDIIRKSTEQQRPGTAGFHLMTDQRTLDMTHKMQEGLDDLLSDKSIKIVTDRSLAYMTRAKALANNWSGIMKEYKQLVMKFDAANETTFGRRTETKYPMHSDILRHEDVRRIGGMGHLPYATTLDARMSQSRQLLDRLMGYVDDEFVDNRGNVRPAARRELESKAAYGIFRDTIIEANRADNRVNESWLRRRLRDYDPDHLRRRATYDFNQRARQPGRYAKPLAQRSGLMGAVTSIFGAYFFQSSLHEMARKTERMFNSFIQPGEIIEARKHSSTETTVRRMVTTDFGAKWSYALGSFLKDQLFGGRLKFQQLNTVLNKFGASNARALLDPKVRREFVRNAKGYATEWIGMGKDAPSAGEIKWKVREIVNDSYEGLKKHWKAATISTGSVLLLTRFGESQVERDDIDFLRSRYSRTSSREHLQYNTAHPEEAYRRSPNINRELMTGFGSPFDARKWVAGKFIAFAGRRGQVIHGVTRKEPGEMLGKIIQGMGFKFPMTLGTQSALDAKAASFLKSREAFNRIPNNWKAGDIAKGSLHRSYDRAVSDIDIMVQSSKLTGPIQSPASHGRLQEMYKDMARLGEEVAEKTGQLKQQQAIPGFLPKPKAYPEYAGFGTIAKEGDRAAKQVTAAKKLARKNVRDMSGSRRATMSGDVKRADAANRVNITRPQQTQQPVTEVFKGKSSKDMPYEDVIPASQYGFKSDRTRFRLPYDAGRVASSKGMRRAALMRDIPSGAHGVAYQSNNMRVYAPVDTGSVMKNATVDMNGFVGNKFSSMERLVERNNAISGAFNLKPSKYVNGKSYSNRLQEHIRSEAVV